jgi:hypothetical protein
LRALARLETAERALKGVEESIAGLPFAQAERWQGVYDRRARRVTAALLRVLRCPAPGLAALGLKIALVVDHDAATLPSGEACMAALRADSVRLCVDPSHRGSAAPADARTQPPLTPALSPPGRGSPGSALP